jgi:hypothetical protein
MNEPQTSVPGRHGAIASRIHKVVYSTAMAVGLLALILKVIGMAAAMSIFGIAFAAFCVWLTVRIANRRERWVKRTAATLMVVLVVGYPLSIGPFVWLCANEYLSDASADLVARSIYGPVTWLYEQGPQSIHDVLDWYVSLWA